MPHNTSPQEVLVTGGEPIPSKHDHMGPMWAIGGQIAIWVL